MNKSTTACNLADSALIATLDTEIISTPGRIWRRSRIAQVICVISASRFGKVWCDNCLQWRYGFEACGGGDLATVTGYYRPGLRDFGGRWVFILGKFHRDSSSCRVSWRQLSESQHLYRESGMVNCVLPHSPTLPFPPLLLSGHTQTKKPGERPGFRVVATCNLADFAQISTPCTGQLAKKRMEKKRAEVRARAKKR